jgi:SAM-dependent methyltransferase
LQKIQSIVTIFLVKSWQKVGIGVGVATAVYFLCDGVNLLAKKQEAFTLAKSLVTNKGILNAGAGPRKPFPAQSIARSPEVVANIDIVPDGLPHYRQLDLEKTPYPYKDKQFDVIFTSHVLEHLTNWQEALSEMRRIADWVIVVLPNPLSLPGWLVPAHRQHFSFQDIASLQKVPGVIVFY